MIESAVSSAPSRASSAAAMLVGALLAAIGFGAQIIVAAPGPGAYLIPQVALLFGLALLLLGTVSLVRPQSRPAAKRAAQLGLAVLVLLFITLSFS